MESRAEAEPQKGFILREDLRRVAFSPFIFIQKERR